MFCNREKGLRRIAAGLLVCTALACSSCREEKPRTRRPVDLVPSKADVIVVLDYERLVKSEVFRRVFDVSNVERTLLAIGIPPENILGIAGFATVNLPALATGSGGHSEESPGEFGMIVQGKGGFHPVLEALAEGRWVRREYGGKELWAADEDNMAVASAGSEMLIVGTPAAVCQAIDVSVGKSSGAMEAGSDSDCGAILRRIGTRAEINIAMSFSQEMKMAAKEVSQSAGIFGGMTGANMLRHVFDVLGMGRGVALSFGGAEKGIATRLVFVARDAASAKLIEGLVKVAKILIPAIGESGPMEEAAEMARGLHVASENDLVLIDFRIPVTVLRGRVR